MKNSKNSLQPKENKKKAGYNNVYASIGAIRADCTYTKPLYAIRNKKMKIIQLSILIILIFGSCSKKESKSTIVQNEISQIEIKSDLSNETKSDLKKKENQETKILKYESKHSFKNYEVNIFKGKLSNPNFENNPFADDKEYIKFITEGCEKNGINFGGKYSVFTNSCGMECSHLFIVDRKNGEIFTEINLTDGKYGYEFRPNSTMLIANSDLFLDKDFKIYEEHYHWKPELYNWNGNEFEIKK